MIENEVKKVVIENEVKDEKEVNNMETQTVVDQDVKVKETQTPKLKKCFCTKYFKSN